MHICMCMGVHVWCMRVVVVGVGGGVHVCIGTADQPKAGKHGTDDY